MVNIVRGPSKAPFRAVVYGGVKTGKTTFASGAPGAVLLSGEGGEGQIDCARLVFESYKAKDPVTGETRVVDRFIPKSWDEFMGMLKRLQVEGVPATPGTKERTLVIDGFGDIEALCIKNVLATVKDDKNRALPSLNAQWGIGDGAHLSAMREAWAIIESIWERQGVNIIITCHERMTKFTDYRGDYMKRAPALNSAAKGDVAGWLAGWADVIALVEIESEDVVIGRRGLEKEAIHARRPTGRRLVRLAPDDSFVAGCRLKGVDSMIVLPHPDVASPWGAFWAQVQAGPLDPAKVRAEFDALLALVPETEAEKREKLVAIRDGENSTRAMWQLIQKKKGDAGASTQGKAA